ncbi:MAG TPA: hypothetical protein VHR97_13815 [Candidatus Baltobacteraceae bacterium]|nr:hypothetical protein [Candidatus Baltobacteraceae bacterium]
MSVLEELLTFTRGYLTYAAAAALIAFLGGCSGAGQPAAQQFVPNALRPATSSSGDLLYISDSGTNKVYVFSYPDGTLVQTLSGFSTPLHECSDTAGNVFITNTGKSEILEYAHGGDTPIATLHDAQQSPVDCAVDPVTHNLAVTNYGQKGIHKGSVSIYAKSKGKAKKHRTTAALAYLFCTYDDSGNLFVTGLDYKYNLVFLELPKGKSAFVQIALKQTFLGWGGVQWDGQNVTIGDGASTVYRFAIKNQMAQKVGVVQLTGAVNIASYLLDGDQLIGPDGPNGGNHDVGVWNYPAGGQSIATVKGSFENPSGVTISHARSH